MMQHSVVKHETSVTRKIDVDDMIITRIISSSKTKRSQNLESVMKSPFLPIQLLILLVLGSTLPCSSFILRPSTYQNFRIENVAVDWRSSSIAASQLAILDGSDLDCLEKFVRSESPHATSGRKDGDDGKRSLKDRDDRVAYCSIVTGSTTSNSDGNTRVIGIAAESSEEGALSGTVEIKGDGNELVTIYEDSMAYIPKSVADADAISTCAASLVGIHCAIHDPLRANIVKGIGGSEDDFVAPITDVKEKKIAIMGGSEYACFIAE